MSESEGFTNGKPHIATADDLTRPWGGARDGSRFRCYLCGHRFGVGDVYRWVFTNSIKGAASGNPFTCEACDGPDVIARWTAHCEEFARDKGDKWWWLVNQECIRAGQDADR